mmetsp:Transcript_39243/g.63635  ORF Transcript_39243/g.63635 Transcript_39243/m.63635 type:complete len:375 (+) Transcript_39243:110-1234(+)|eukprot:CAMPEP_0184648218 /NCGR_PEP_ID=MMETSP0308-20130426/5289_1 /TAXON_ID=38269 /ORGANISM="Gloeochaete witrockiana, Strain SAG 46.84" /LENGTH=374 /DNA_ID=CAMNT_0027079863 /DNA_START=36 /DNA_END=1160 /DNA_ORIENTATION=+
MGNIGARPTNKLDASDDVLSQKRVSSLNERINILTRFLEQEDAGALYLQSGTNGPNDRTDGEDVNKPEGDVTQEKAESQERLSECWKPTEMLIKDVGFAAQLVVGAESDMARIERCIRVFDEQFSVGFVQLCVNGKLPVPRFSFRSSSVVTVSTLRSWYEAAKKEQLIISSSEGKPCHKFVDSFFSADGLQMTRGGGLEFDAWHGLVRMSFLLEDNENGWDRMLQLPIPPQMSRFNFTSYDLRRPTLITVDFQQNSLEVFFLNRTELTPAVVAEMLGHHDMLQPDDNRFLFSCTSAVVIGFSFRWGEYLLDRLLFVRAGIPLSDICAAQVSTLSAFAARVPSRLAPTQQFFTLFYIFGRTGAYLRLECDYGGHL